MMIITIYSILGLLVILFIMVLVSALLKKRAHIANPQSLTTSLLPAALKSDGDEHFTRLVSHVTPVWYWRVNHEYLDFINATINKMSLVQLTDIPGLFDAQRRCSVLNSAVYHYYSSLKKRCLEGEKVTSNDLDVLNMRHCFEEFSFHAYPALVALVWPEFSRPPLSI